MPSLAGRGVFDAHHQVRPSLAQLTRRGRDLVCVQLLAPEELTPTAEEAVQWIDAETGETRTLLVDRTRAAAYERVIVEGTRSLLEASRRAGVKRFLYISTIATQYPHAAGIAYTLRQQGSPGVVVVSGGEGSTSEGDWHEAMNFASIHDLPVVFIIENNHYAISVREENEVAGSIAERARGYGMAAESIDGNDVLMVYATTRNAVDRARNGGGPSLIEAQTYRYYGHTSEDRDSDYRTAEEVERWRKKDPILRLHQYLVEARLQLDGLLKQIPDQLHFLEANARLHRASGQNQKALDSLDTALQLYPSQLSTTLLQAELLVLRPRESLFTEPGRELVDGYFAFALHQKGAVEGTRGEHIIIEHREELFAARPVDEINEASLEHYRVAV